MASTNTKKFPQDDASAAPSTSTALTEATSAAAADAPPFTAVAAASTSEAPSWAPRSSASPPPALPSERPQERGPEPPGAGTSGGWSFYAARVDRKGKKVAACEDATTSTGSRGSLLAAWPASPVHEVKLLRGKGIWTNEGSCSTSRCDSAVINEKKTCNTETTANLPIQALQGKSAQGSRYWELHDCPSNVEGMNPPGFSSPHPVWEGFAAPVKKEGGKLSFFCVACKKLLSGNAAAATNHMLGTKGCAISEEGKIDLKTRIREFDDRRSDLKRKRKEPKEGVVQGARKATPGQQERDKDQVSIPDHCSHLCPTGLEDIFRLVTDRWPEPDDDQISSFDPLSHSFPTAQTFVLCPATGANEDLFWLPARQEPEDNHASSSYSSSCSTARTETLTACPLTGDEGSEAVEESHQDQVSALDSLSCSRPTNDHFH